MITNRTFRTEVIHQLKDDILSFGWLRQIAFRDFGHATEAEGKRAVLDLVCDLVESGIAVVGSTQTEGEMVVIDPWSERGESLHTRLERAIDEALPQEQEWVFWLQLVEHYHKK